MNKFGFVVLLAVVGSAIAQAPQRYRQNSRRLFARQEEAPAPYPASGWQPTGARLELPTEVATTTDLPTTTTDVYEETTTEQQSGPYQSSGWTPAGSRLELPTEQQEPVEQPSDQQPSQVYGVPHQAYGPPAQEYGPPKETDENTSDEQEEDASGDGSENRSATDNPEVEELEVNQQGQQEFNEKNENQQNEPEQFEQVDVSAPLQPGQGAYFIQLADGTLQRLVYLPPDQIVQPAQQIAQPVKLINPIVVPQYVQYNAQYQTGW